MARPQMGMEHPVGRLPLLLHQSRSLVRVGIKQQGLCRGLLCTHPRSRAPKPDTHQRPQQQRRVGLLQMSRLGRRGASGSSRRRPLLAG